METSEDILQIAVELIRRSQTPTDDEPRKNQSFFKPNSNSNSNNTNNEPPDAEDPDGFVHVDSSDIVVVGSSAPASPPPPEPEPASASPPASAPVFEGCPEHMSGTPAELAIEYAEFAQKYPYLFRMCTNVPTPESADNLIKILPMMLRQRDRVLVAEGQDGGGGGVLPNNIVQSDRLKSATETVMQRLNDTYVAPLGIKLSADYRNAKSRN
jgi:hypothetical protein